MFTLPDELPAYHTHSPLFYYLHVNNTQTNNSRLHFTKYCISVGINGTKKLQTTKGIEVFGQGDLIFYTPGNYLSYQNIDTDEPYKSLMIFFDAPMFSDLAAQFGDKNTIRDNPVGDQYYLSVKSNVYITNFARSILNLLLPENEFPVSLQKVKLVELIVYLRNVVGDFLAEGNRNVKQLSDRQLQRVIESRSHGNLSLDEIAFMCNMSLATFKRSFLRIYGTSPGKWMREKKLAWAEKQIREHGRLPKEIYREAGYRDYSSFSHAFRQKFGTSPRGSYLAGR